MNQIDVALEFLGYAQHMENRGDDPAMSAFAAISQAASSIAQTAALDRIAARLDNGVPVENVTGGYR